VTSPNKLPVKLIDVLAVLAFPFKDAVMIPAAKLPELSLSTTVFGILRGVAVPIAVAAAAIEAALAPPTKLTVVAAEPGPDPVTSPVKEVIALAEPRATSTPEESCI
jgi:hypothetical protein